MMVAVPEASERNVLGEPLDPCGTDPMTGFYRDGTCPVESRTSVCTRCARW